MKANHLKNIIFLLLISLVSCSKEDSDQVYTAQLEIAPVIEYVAPHPPAHPDSPKDIPAIKVKETNKSEEYHLGLKEINGFVFEEGYRYIIKVEITILANPPIDGNPKTYKLIQLISKDSEVIGQ